MIAVNSVVLHTFCSGMFGGVIWCFSVAVYCLLLFWVDIDCCVSCVVFDLFGFFVGVLCGLWLVVLRVWLWFGYDNCEFVSLPVVSVIVGYSVACWFAVCGWFRYCCFALRFCVSVRGGVWVVPAVCLRVVFVGWFCMFGWFTCLLLVVVLNSVAMFASHFTLGCG